MHDYVNDIHNIIEQYKNMVYAIALTHVQTCSNADDVLQEVFLAYYKSNKAFNDEEHRKAWLIKTTLNQCKKLTSSSWWKRVIPFNKEIKPNDDGSFQFALPEENAVYLAVCNLPEKYRIVVYLYYFQDYNSEEIGKILKIKTSTIRTRLIRGRDILRVKLKGEIFNE
ncbi:sigma-70 family RNA polymerase sigma factor [Clostridiaceae bacterium M8S5]|nr:sigma-70 family RNA polymerase sigma factor [Clostridiaceae bacterium M8S5]